VRRHDRPARRHRSQNRAADKWLGEVVRWTWKVKLYTHLETDLLGELREGADRRRSTSPTTCTTCCWPPRPARAPPWASTRACARLQGRRGRRHRQAAGSPPRLPARRRTSGTRPSPCWPPCAPSTRSLIAIGNGTASRETDKLAAS
jgi:uncharacterized protein